MPRPYTGRIPVTVRLDPDQLETIDEIAVAINSDRSGVIRGIVRRGLKRSAS
jgi:predicted transcriptional regulator